MDSDKIPYRFINGVGFDVYRSKEIKELSVLEITNLKTFDGLGHPSTGGLYDAKLGPVDRDDICSTCNLNEVHCPGHVGHINLPLPIFNPVFFRTLQKILKGSCFTCEHLFAPPAMIQLTLMQLNALDYGLVGLVQELGDLAAETLTAQVSKNALMNASVVKEILQTAFDKALETLDPENSLPSFSMIKNVVESRQKIVKTFFSDYLTKGDRKCAYCGSKRRGISAVHNSRFIFTGASAALKVVSKKVLPRLSGRSLADLLVDHDDDEFENEESRIEGNTNNETTMDLQPSFESQTYFTPLDAKKHMQKVWENEKVLLSKIFGFLRANPEAGDESPIDFLFMDAVLVPPSRFRPLSFMNGKKYENSQTLALQKVLLHSITLSQLVRVMNSGDSNVPEAAQIIVKSILGKTNAEKLHNKWNELQIAVNIVIDSDLDKLNLEKFNGVKQILEKKEGLFRKHMMGKRVNYAARSVISPDPYIMVDEIGIPTVFALKLTYPQPVTPWNVQQLRKAVINGPNIYPGAVLVQNEEGSIIKLSPTERVQREAIAKQLLTPSLSFKKRGCKIVYRHLLNGDVLLLNRQPTLHKPSIMAHRARVLPGEKTLRLHYANCKSYNADFDGDEMNAHFPQSELGRAEAYNLANVSKQYLVPKDGTPLSGLIQDHMIAGVLLTMRGNFFSRDDYQSLLFGALTFLRRPIKLLPPTIRKPRVLWSGKQIFSTILINIIPDGKPPPNLEGTAKIPEKAWLAEAPRPWLAGGTPLPFNSMSESEVIIQNGELLCGVLDKAHYGPTPYGLVHCCYEIYGGNTSSLLLTSLARLFTHYLQQHAGFTLGIEDILVTSKADKKRVHIMKKARKCGDGVVAEALMVNDIENKSLLYSAVEKAHRDRDDRGLKELDNSMKGQTDGVNNDINRACFPNGLIKTFPDNNLQLMVQSGAKGSTVNCMQISCLLGQIELEGRRVPLMMSGRTLPSFRPYSTTPRAGGFIDGRFLTGIRPQEFFFHCMAGREGLVDTAVKTSRSGYLQRCLIKHLEGIIVNYDMTVRDSDGSVIQFNYGEDGLDIMKSQLMKEKVIPLMIRNHEAIAKKDKVEEILGKVDSKSALKIAKKIHRWKKKHRGKEKRTSGFMVFANDNSEVFQEAYTTNNLEDFQKAKRDLEIRWRELDEETKKEYSKHVTVAPDPVSGQYRPDTHFGSISEKLEEVITNYAQKNPDGLLDTGDSWERKNVFRVHRNLLPLADFRNMIYYRYMQSLCDPGEAVGLLAAQSIGEPSTQMTLNTFHFAGRGEMNVTLGIPRLREILMTASANLSTPSMDLPLLPQTTEEEADKLRLKFNCVLLYQLLESVNISESISISGEGICRLYKIKFNFLPQKAYKDKFTVNPAKILFFMEKIFFKKMIESLKRKISANKNHRVSTKRLKTKKNSEEGDGEGETVPALPDFDAGESSDDGEGDGDTTSTKQKMRHDQETEYQEPEEVENQGNVSDNEEVVDEPQIPEDASVTTKEENEDGPPEISEPPRKKSRREMQIGDAEVFERVAAVLSRNNWISEYNFDTKKQLWCEIVFKLALDNTKLDMMSFIETEAAKTIVYETPNIKRAFLVKDHKTVGGCGKMLKTEGVNFMEMFKHEALLDMKRIYSNDIHAIANTFGIEAASRAIFKEVTNVFAAYGIEVDPRHLFLISDYMTSEGSFRAFNRVGLESNASPFQQMTFETTMHFLRSSTLAGFDDDLKSPSSRIILGQVVHSGTGCMGILLPRGKARKK